MVELAFVGTGEAFDPELPNTSLLLRATSTLLFDCGYAVPHAFWRLTQDPEALDAIYLSHRHADHCFGLPALLVWMRFAGRRRPLWLLGGPDVVEFVPRVLEQGYPGAYDPAKCFPISVAGIAPGSSFQLGDLTLRTAPSQHGVSNHAVRIDVGGLGLAYSGDGAPTEATRELFTDVDLLVHECYGVAPPIKGHAHVEELLELAVTSRVQHLCLLHLAAEPTVRERVRAAIEQLPPGAGPQRISLPSPGERITL